MKHQDHHQVKEHHNQSSDSTIDAVAAMVLILCVATMGILWVSGQG